MLGKEERVLHIILFNIAQALATVYAFWRGGAPERVVGLSLAAASLATLITTAIEPMPVLGYRSVVDPRLPSIWRCWRA